MKKYILIAPALLAMAACGGNKQNADNATAADSETIMLTYLCDPMGEKVDSAAFPVDDEGYAVIFNG